MLGKAETVPGWLKALDLDQYESSMMANGFDDVKFLVGLGANQYSVTQQYASFPCSLGSFFLNNVASFLLRMKSSKMTISWTLELLTLTIEGMEKSILFAVRLFRCLL